MSTAWLTPALINRLEVLELSVKAARAGHRLGGRFTVNRRGSSIEFADYAPYYAGDDIRSIDWSLYARLDKLFVKTYKEEIALSVELLVDATPSMRLPSSDKFLRANQLAVCLGYIALGDGHYVRTSWVAADRLAPSPWYHQRSDLFRLAHQAEQTRVGAAVDVAEWIRRAAIALRMHGGQAIYITDGMVRPAELFRALHVLQSRNVEMSVIQVITPQELHPRALATAGMLVDAETGSTHQLAYKPAELEQAMASHNELLARLCKRHGMKFAQYRTDQSLDTFITTTLPARGFLE